MLKEAMQYLRDTAAPNIRTFDDKQFSDKEMKRICTKDYPDEIHMTTLTGLKDYLLSGSLKNERVQDLIIQIHSPKHVSLRDFEEMQQKGMGLYLFSGTPGSGKTFMAACLANELIRENGKRVRFATSMDIIEEIKRSWDFSSGHSESQVLQELTDTDVLIIDDFGVEQPKNWIAERFYQIINARYTLKKITIITSNLSVEDLKYDSRIKNRVQERTYQLPFPEESIRGQIARENMSDMMNRVRTLREQQKHRNEQLTLKL